VRVLLSALVVGCVVLMAGAAQAGESGDSHGPGRGLTAELEVSYLRFIINHHYGALRMTELAAGSDEVRNPDLTPGEGTTPTEGFARVEAKARLNELRSLARRNNRAQREEILTAQRFLRTWYGITHEPQLTESGREAIAILEATPAGTAFDQAFIEVFSRHHFMAVVPSTECLVARDLNHPMLEGYCRSIVNAQLTDIEEMRHTYCDEYGVCDYQPLTGIRGRRSEAPRSP